MALASLLVGLAVPAQAAGIYRGESGSLQFRLDNNSFAPGFEGHLLSDPAAVRGRYPTVNATGAMEEASAQAAYVSADYSTNPPTYVGHEGYCLQLDVDAPFKTTYRQGTFEKSAIDNIGYAARIVQTFTLNGAPPDADLYHGFPQQPSATPVNDLRGPAIQLAIWYFTNGLVVDQPTGTPDSNSPNAANTLRPAVAAIVDQTLALGPITTAAQPAVPAVHVTPPSTTAAPGQAAGPFTLTGNNGITQAALTVTNGVMYTDAAATRPLADGTIVPVGTSVYIESPGSTATLTATATATAVPGSVLIYDGLTAGLPNAQALILASTQTRTATDSASAVFAAPTPTPTTATVTTTTAATTTATTTAAAATKTTTVTATTTRRTVTTASLTTTRSTTSTITAAHHVTSTIPTTSTVVVSTSAATPSLASTGVNTTGEIFVAVLAVALGGLALGLGGRRKKSSH